MPSNPTPSEAARSALEHLKSAMVCGASDQELLVMTQRALDAHAAEAVREALEGVADRLENRHRKGTSSHRISVENARIIREEARKYQ